jgi:hypothetical protein
MHSGKNRQDGMFFLLAVLPGLCRLKNHAIEMVDESSFIVEGK